MKQIIIFIVNRSIKSRASYIFQTKISWNKNYASIYNKYDYI